MHIENGTGDRGMNGRILSSDYCHKQTNYGGKEGNVSLLEDKVGK